MIKTTVEECKERGACKDALIFAGAYYPRRFSLLDVFDMDGDPTYMNYAEWFLINFYNNKIIEEYNAKRRELWPVYLAKIRKIALEISKYKDMEYDDPAYDPAIVWWNKEREAAMIQVLKDNDEWNPRG